MPDFPERVRSLEPFWNAWYLDDLLGKGSFGTVFRIYREEFGERTEAAMKWIPLPYHQGEIVALRGSGLDDASIRRHFEEKVHEMQEEIMLMSSLRGSSHVVSLEDYAFIPRQNEIGWDILIRMELLKSLSQRLVDGMTVGDVVRMGVDLCDALSLCGKMQIIHRDIKPDNIFVNGFGDYKLGDFGVARRMQSELTTMSMRGTPNYMAPEVFRREKGDASVDQYSLGLVMHRLLNAQQLPFAPTFDRMLTHEEREQSFLQRMQGKPVPLPMQGSQRLKEAVCRACSFHPRKRYPSIEAFRQALEATLKDRECAEPLVRIGQLGMNSLRSSLPAGIPATNRKSRWPMVAAGLGATGLAMLGAVLLAGGDSEPRPTAMPTVAVTETVAPMVTEAPTVVPTAVPTEVLASEPQALGDLSAVDSMPKETPKTMLASIAEIMMDAEEVSQEPEPSDIPTPEATAAPTPAPTAVPTEEPTPTPTAEPTEEPTPTPTAVPTEEPTPTPTAVPTEEPTPAPTAVPTEEPTPTPTAEPTAPPTPAPTVSIESLSRSYQLGSAQAGWFATGQRIEVYSGPGNSYLRGAKGKAVVSTVDWVDCYGYADGWYLVEYSVNKSTNRRGYIRASSIRGNYKLNDALIPNVGLKVQLIAKTSLTDDPDHSKSELCELNRGSEGTLLFFYGDWACIEAYSRSGWVQGYVPSSVLELTETVWSVP